MERIHSDHHLVEPSKANAEQSFANHPRREEDQSMGNKHPQTAHSPTTAGVLERHVDGQHRTPPTSPHPTVEQPRQDQQHLHQQSAERGRPEEAKHCHPTQPQQQEPISTRDISSPPTQCQVPTATITHPHTEGVPVKEEEEMSPSDQPTPATSGSTGEVRRTINQLSSSVGGRSEFKDN